METNIFLPFANCKQTLISFTKMAASSQIQSNLIHAIQIRKKSTGIGLATEGRGRGDVELGEQYLGI